MVVLWSAEHICSVVLDPKIRRFYMVDVQFVCLFVCLFTVQFVRQNSLISEVKRQKGIRRII